MWHRMIIYFIVFSVCLYPIHVSKSSELSNSIIKEQVIVSLPMEEKIELPIQSVENNLVKKETDSKKLRVKKILTEISETDLKELLAKTHLEVFNKPASDKRIHMAWAQIAFENGRGKKVYNYNLGNIGGHPTTPVLPYYRVAGSRFRSFESFEEGAKFYWQHLKERCSGALPYFDLGDPYTASIALGKCGYYRSDVEHYLKNLSSLYFESYKKL